MSSTCGKADGLSIGRMITRQMVHVQRYYYAFIMLNWNACSIGHSMVMTPYVNEWSQIIASFLPENVREGRTTWNWETILLLTNQLGDSTVANKFRMQSMVSLLYMQWLNLFCFITYLLFPQVSNTRSERIVVPPKQWLLFH